MSEERRSSTFCVNDGHTAIQRCNRHDIRGHSVAGLRGLCIYYCRDRCAHDLCLHRFARYYLGQVLVAGAAIYSHVWKHRCRQALPISPPSSPAVELCNSSCLHRVFHVDLFRMVPKSDARHCVVFRQPRTMGLHDGARGWILLLPDSRCHGAVDAFSADHRSDPRARDNFVARWFPVPGADAMRFLRVPSARFNRSPLPRMWYSV